jgi:hypothetical protein
MSDCGCSQNASYSMTPLNGGGKKKSSTTTTKPKKVDEQVIKGVKRTIYTLPGKGNTHFVRVKQGGKLVFVPKTKL